MSFILNAILSSPLNLGLPLFVVNLGLTIEVLIGLVFTGLILKLSKTTLVPIISACILPIVLRTETWVYPISVFIPTILIVSIKYFIEDYGVSEEVKEEFKEEIAKLERNTSLRKKEFIRIFSRVFAQLLRMALELAR